MLEQFVGQPVRLLWAGGTEASDKLVFLGSEGGLLLFQDLTLKNTRAVSVHQVQEIRLSTVLAVPVPVVAPPVVAPVVTPAK